MYYNNIAVTINQTISYYDSTLLKIDPNFNGSGSISFTYTTLDSATQVSISAGTITMPFTSLTIGGTVYNDANGLVDATINGTGLGNPSSLQLYANLIDSATNNTARAVTVITGTGVYLFSDSVNLNSAYKVIISTIQGTVGRSAPSITLPNTWVNVGENYGSNNGNGSGNESGLPNGIIAVHTLASNVTSTNFGIERICDAYNKSYSGLNPNFFNTPSGNEIYPYKVILNAPGGTEDGQVMASSSSIAPGKVSGADPEDGKYCGLTGNNSSRTLVFASLPNFTNEILVYDDGTQPVLLVQSPTSNDSSFKYFNTTNGLYEIPSFNANNLSVFIKKNGHTSFIFTYAWRDAANQLGSTATYEVQAYGPLPVTWLSFTASWNDNNAKLQWATTMEINNDHFEIERSFDNKTFEYIWQENPTNNGNVNHYIFEDLGSRQLAKEVLYYRIKQIDKDNQYSYSPVQTLNIQKDNEVSASVYPNPVVETTSLRISTSNDGQISYTISNIDGKIIKLETITTTSGVETFESIDMIGLAKGIYFLNLKGNNLNRTIRLVKIDSL